MNTDTAARKWLWLPDVLSDLQSVHLRWFSETLQCWHKVPLNWHKHSRVISDVKVTLRNFCFEWLSGAMMHTAVFHFCLATNRQQVAQLCVWVEAVEALTWNSDWGPTVIHFLLCLPLDVLEVPCEINIYTSYFDISTITIQRIRIHHRKSNLCPFCQFP